MATRFYLKSTGAAAVSPAYDAGWANTTLAARLAMQTTTIASADTPVFCSSQAAPSNEDWLVRQYVSGQYGAQTITGTIHGQVRIFADDTSAYTVIMAYVVSADGTVVRGTLLAETVSANAAPATGTPTNRYTPASVAVTSVDMQSGDRVVVEVGFRLNGTTIQAGLQIGDPSGTDLPVNETTTAVNNPWIELSMTLAPPASAALTGTCATPVYRSDIVAGGKTIIITLTDDTFVASGATFDAQRQAIIDGLDAGNSTANGWNEVVQAGLVVGNVVRTSNTVCTITLPAFASYAPAATQTITVTVPAAALTGGGAVVATPTITTFVGPLLSAYSGTTNGAGVLTFTLTSDDALTTNGEVLVLSATSGSAVSRTTGRPA